MKLLILIILLLFSPRVHALEMTAPTVTGEAAEVMPVETGDLGAGLWEILQSALDSLGPDLQDAALPCCRILAIVLFCSLIHTFPGARAAPLELAECTFISITFLGSARTMVRLALQTLRELSSYAKLLLPVLSSALAAQGRVSSSSALYIGTVAFNTLLSTLAESLLLPLVYVFISLCVANGALAQPLLKKMAQFVKWILVWTLKILLYVFTGYISITGVVSGSTDAAALKAAKITISGVVPVVGGILSDASEAVLVSAGLVKNSVGIYGCLAVCAMVTGPFLQIGVHYLLLKATGALCQVIGGSREAGLIEDFSSAMGLILGMTGAMGLILLISVVCFLRGVG